MCRMFAVCCLQFANRPASPAARDGAFVHAILPRLLHQLSVYVNTFVFVDCLGVCITF